MKKFNLNQGIILTFNQEDEINVDEGKILILPVWKWMAKKK
jgi:predicted AAA+ superfamily ATPase